VEQDLRELFERALDDEPVPPPGDPAQTAMVRGTRLRQRRNLLAGGGAATVVAVLATIVGLNLAAPADETIPPVAAGVAQPTARPTCTLPVGGATKAASIFLSPDITDAQRQAIYTTLKAEPGVRSVAFESSELAYQRFKILWKDSPDFVKSVDPAQLPESFRLTLRGAGDYAPLVVRLKGRPGINEIVRGVCPDPSATGEGK
jgi:cell division transport system permease protein